MAKPIQYLVVQMQDNYVTFVDGVWQGSADPGEPEALSTCRKIWDYLHEVGRDGWELITCFNESYEHASRQVLLFKRPLDW